MKITARGWNRDMGPWQLLDVNLADLWQEKGTHKYLSNFGGTALLHDPDSVHVKWGKSIRMTGDYRLAVEFSPSDVMKLFKLLYGTELNVSLLEKHGFTVSEDLKKVILGTVKFADLTVGQLVSMGTQEKAEEKQPAQSAEVKPFLRRV